MILQSIAVSYNLQTRFFRFPGGLNIFRNVFIYISREQRQGGLSLKEYIEERVFEIANYILENNCTVRTAAKKFEVSKSTVHKDMVERLPALSAGLAEEVRLILNENKAERHIRGGLATKAKYEKKKGIL